MRTSKVVAERSGVAVYLRTEITNSSVKSDPGRGRQHATELRGAVGGSAAPAGRAGHRPHRGGLRPPHRREAHLKNNTVSYKLL
jgi:hypothetical protein